MIHPEVLSLAWQVLVLAWEPIPWKAPCSLLLHKLSDDFSLKASFSRII